MNSSNPDHCTRPDGEPAGVEPARAWPRHRAGPIGQDEALAYRAIVEDQHELISLADPVDLTLRYVNPAYARNYGLPRDTLLGRCLLDWTAADEREAVRERLRQVCRSRQVEHSQNRIVDANGNERWVRWTNRALVDAQGEVTLLHSVGRDITDELRGQTDTARLAAVVTSSADAIVAKTLEGVITTWNPSAARLFGHSAEQAIGRSILLIVPPDRHGEEDRLVERARAGHSVVEFETQRRRADGRLIDVSLTISPIRDARGAVIGVSKIARDIGERRRLQAALAASERQHRALYESSPAMLQSLDAAGRLVSVSDAWLQHLGYRRDEVIGHPVLDFFATLPGTEAAPVGEIHQMRRRDGSVIDVRLSSAVERDAQGRPLREMAAIEDVTESRRLTRVLAQEHERLRVTLQSIADAVITVDTEARVDFLNPVAEALTGWSLADALGRPIEQVFSVVDELSREPIANPVRRCLAEGRSVGLHSHGVLIGRDGREWGVEDSAAPMRDADGRLLGGVLVFRDVTSQRRLASEIRFRASHDTLTGLVNRSEFEDRLKRLLQRVHLDGGHHALLYIDLDQFKLVNDTCGHAAGDLLLQQVSALMQRCVRSADTLARLGGDEFAVLLDHCRVDQAERVAQQICDHMDEYRFLHGDRRFRLGASIGLVPIDARWPDTATLLQAADSSCMAAKAAGRNRVHSGHDTDRLLQTYRGEAQWASRLDSALEDGRFLLYAQRIFPVSAGDSGRAPLQSPPALHAEVLLRLRDVDGEVIRPGAFLPAAERFHLATRIDRWVLRQVLNWMARHRLSLGPDDLLSVNLSGQSISDRAFHHYAAELLDGQPGLATRLCLELTETAAITNLFEATRFVTEMRQRGVRVALDDFGSGASSFGYLKTLPLDFLKIDGQFIRGLGHEALDLAAVRSFCDVAGVLGVRTVAEFVEQPATLEELSRLGVDFAQGHLLHRPEPIDALLASLRSA